MHKHHSTRADATNEPLDALLIESNGTRHKLPSGMFRGRRRDGEEVSMTIDGRQVTGKLHLPGDESAAGPVRHRMVQQ